MKDAAAVRWFKMQFQKQIETALADTPFSVDLLTAIAMQETGYLWRAMVEAKLGIKKILELCVGDTIDDTAGRGAFPKNKAALIAASNGQEIFNIARAALAAVAPHNEGYAKAAKNQNKFCHGFGIFQYDLQFVKKDPDYFLKKQWADFGICLGKVLTELKEASKRVFGSGKTSLTDTEQVFVAIAYNRGSVSLSKGFKQGFKTDDGRFYGENILDFLRVSQSVAVEPGAEPAALPPGRAPLPAPTPIEVTGDLFRVDVQTVLRLRSEPRIPQDDPAGNVIARLPDGQIVHRLAGKKGDDFWEVETSFHGAHLQGFAGAEFLKVAGKGVDEVPVVTPRPEPAEGDIPAVTMPRKDGSITTRSEPAGALSLNEPGQPGRKGETAAERCAELAAIIAWLAVDKASNKRYQSTSQSTFCNIYAHDYCALAGVYLPRVWWLPGAIERLAKGEPVEPVYEKTIDEQRANDLFRWLRDFGPRFGWRATGTLTKLQEAANLGGLGIIVARRKDDGRSGHIVAVVPETNDKRARRNTEGEVIAPLQSQAGSVNFQYGTGKVNWWTDNRFAANAFYIHA
ncbi:MAG: hypothetical protein JO151_07385 [Verrucomicrobia bacterium]|nr:hypothetical protein [Verrucomicrobiota bacterium]